MQQTTKGKTFKSFKMKDYLYISKNEAFKVISRLLENDIKIICNLHDRNGDIDLKVIGIENNFEEETCTISMEHNERHKLHDKFLYNIIYDQSKHLYNIKEQDEYFEKIFVKNHEN